MLDNSLRFALMMAFVSSLVLPAIRPCSADDSLARYRNLALKSGDAIRGKVVFQSEKAACTKCHVVAGSARGAGPDLMGISDKYSRAQLIRAVLRPNDSLLADYTTSIVLTTAGETHTGIVRKRTPTDLQLVDAEGKLIRLAAEDVEEVTKSKLSLMPAGIHTQLSLQQFSDLIEYLVTLKQPPSQNIAVPDAIPKLKEPLKLDAIHSPDMNFDFPTWFHPLPGRNDAFVVLEQKSAKVWLIQQSEIGMKRSLFLDLSSEVSGGLYEGLLCLAFHPDFVNNGLYYLNHSIREDGAFSAIVVERQVAEGLTKDSGRATRRIIQMKQETDLHSGGMVAFGPDGYMYIGDGDGGPQGDPEGHGQNLSLLLGSVLRIDVDRRDEGLEYAIPETNPFHGSDDPDIRQEIWAYGLRQPWRFSWDELTGDFWVGDVGQVLFEEVTLVRAGENHGWNVYEGFNKFSAKYHREGREFVPPVLAYPRKLGVSVTGGYVYRGKRSPSYNGAYIFGDFDSKRLWALTQTNRKLLKVREIGLSPQRIVSFGMDHNGEIYVIGYEGTIYHLNLDNSVFE